ncbi:MAG: GTP-binding protein [Actinobacteria bacterium]|nr:GTP-binding protein [Actinomycetota bacterium]
MAHEVDVYLISGFLGSGKTTFLNRLVKVVPDDLRFLILMNEFGEMGLDGTLVEGEDLDMIEISKGSIFCACVKTDFIKALHEIAHTVRPDIMLIETTGVANPSDLGRDLKLPIFSDAFRLRDKFCLVDAANFLDTYESFLAIEKQLAASDVFIINKLDLVDSETVERIKEIVRGLNPEPRFYEAVYADVSFEGLFREGELRDLADDDGSPGTDGGEDEGAGPDGAAPATMTERELEAYIDDLLTDETAQVTPPDRLLSWVVEWTDGSQEELRAWLDALPEPVVRGKGIVKLEDGLWLFGLVNGKWTIEPYTGPSPREEVVNRLVFISHPEHIAEIARALPR